MNPIRLMVSAYTVFVAAFVLGTAACAKDPAAAKYTVGTLAIDEPWLRATPGGATVGAGYLTIKNTGRDPDRLVGVTLAPAGHVEVHEMRETDGVMQMRELEDGLVVPPGATVVLEPGGLHLMLMDLGRPLKAGEELSGTLSFEKAGSVEVRFRVAPVGAGAPDAGGHH